MVSVVAGNVFLYGFRRWFFMVPVMARTRFFLWFPFLQLQARVGARRGWDASGSRQIHDCAGDARARSDSGIAMRSPVVKDPGSTSGPRGFNPGRARFQGNCVFLFFACLLLSCCLFLLVCLFCCFLLEPGGKAEKQSREAPLHVMFPLRVRHASIMFPARLRHVSVAFPWCASPWPLPGASVKEASVREQS